MSTNTLSVLENGSFKEPQPLTINIEGREFEWNGQYITGLQAKKLAGLPQDVQLMLAIADPWDDEPVDDSTPIDLAREGVECFFVKRNLPFTFDSQKYEWDKQFITGLELRQIRHIKDDEEIILLVQSPWEDEVIGDKSKVDLARPGIEHFSVRKKGAGLLVRIEVNNKSYQITRGKHTVAELKQLAGIPVCDELEQLLDKKLVPLEDSGSVLIKGYEQFFSHKRDGSSS